MYFASINIILFWDMHILPNFYSQHFESWFSAWFHLILLKQESKIREMKWFSKGHMRKWQNWSMRWGLPSLCLALVKCSRPQTLLLWTSVRVDAHRMLLNMEHGLWVTMLVGQMHEIGNSGAWDLRMSNICKSSRVSGAFGAWAVESRPVGLTGALHRSSLGSCRASLDLLFLLFSLFSLSSGSKSVSSLALQFLQWERGALLLCVFRI